MLVCMSSQSIAYASLLNQRVCLILGIHPGFAWVERFVELCDRDDFSSPFKGEVGRGMGTRSQVSEVRSQKSEKKSDRHFMLRYREKRGKPLSDRHALYVSQCSFAARAPIPTLALPLKGREYSAAEIHSKI